MRPNAPFGSGHMRVLWRFVYHCNAAPHGAAFWFLRIGWTMMRSKVTGAQRWVVKIGSALLTADGKGLDRVAMGVWCPPGPLRRA
jgi:hypothetical protein